MEIFTTDGSSCLASCENAVDNWTGFGITSGVAPGAAWSFAAFTPVLTSVPIRIPTESVNKINVEESSFRVRIVFRKFIRLIYTPALSTQNKIISLALIRWMLLNPNRFQLGQQNPCQNQNRAQNRSGRQS